MEKLNQQGCCCCCVFLEKEKKRKLKEIIIIKVYKQISQQKPEIMDSEGNTTNVQYKL